MRTTILAALAGAWCLGIAEARAGEPAAGDPGKSKEGAPAAAPVGPVTIRSEDRGKTMQLQVGQAVMVRLDADDSSGWIWKFEKSRSDAVLLEDAPRGSHGRVPNGHFGGVNMSLFCLRAARPGTATVIFRGGRPWEWKGESGTGLETRSLTIEVVVAPREAARRLEAARKDAAKLVLRLSYSGPEDKPFYRLVLGAIPEEKKAGGAFTRRAPLAPEQAGRLIDWLDRSGFILRAADSKGKAVQGYSLEVSAGEGKPLHEDLGWGPAMLERFDSLAKALDGAPAEALKPLLDRLEGLRKEWAKPSK